MAEQDTHIGGLLTIPLTPDTMHSLACPTEERETVSRERGSGQGLPGGVRGNRLGPARERNEEPHEVGAEVSGKHPPGSKLSSGITPHSTQNSTGSDLGFKIPNWVHTFALPSSNLVEMTKEIINTKNKKSVAALAG